MPGFKNEDQERAFWANHDSASYLRWDKAERVNFSKLKPSLKTISLRLPEAMLETLKMIANKRDVPYQSLLKIFLSERIQDELEIPQEKAHKKIHNKRVQRTLSQR
ncbi:MAG: hypothetical protein GF350_06210 [Chitinivibrionales bacterium]|nr:hypothetical protein [Chitinivibrionales bacterium]